MLLVAPVAAQSCLPEGIIFTNQAQVNSFPTDYPGCTTVEGTLAINYVSNLGPLSQITSVGGNIQIGSTQCTNLNGLHNLTHVGGSMRIEVNAQLNTLEALSNLTAIGGTLQLRNNNALSNLSGLENLATVGGNLEIGESATLINLQGLEGIESIGQWINIRENTALTSMQGLSPSSVGGAFSIVLNPLLEDLRAAQGLTSLGGAIFLNANPSITSLMDLQNITTINGTLAITGCPELTSLDGMDQISSSGITYLTIAGNSSLAQCAVENVCSYLVDAAKPTNIHSNGPGCADRAEVEAACVFLSVEDAMRKVRTLSIYPNPSSGLVMLKAEGHGTMQLMVFDMAGRSVHEERLSPATEGSHTIDLAHLPSGVYSLRIQRGLEITTARLVRH